MRNPKACILALALNLSHFTFAMPRDCSDATQLQGVARTLPVFEDVYPEQQHSIRSIASRVHRKVLDVLFAYPDFDSFFPPGVQAVGTPGPQIIEWIFAGRAKMAQDILAIRSRVERDIADHIKTSRQTNQRAQRSVGDAQQTIRNLKKTSRALEIFAQRFAIAVPQGDFLTGYGSYAEYQEVLKKVAGVQYYDPIQFTSHAGAFVNRAYSTSGLVRVAMAVPDLLGMEVVLRTLGRRHEDLPLYPVEKLQSAEGQLRLDLIFRDLDNRICWGEVVTSHDVVESGVSWKHTWTKLNELKVLRIILAPATPIHFFFVNGIASKAKAALEAEGVFVHGAVVP